MRVLVTGGGGLLGSAIAGSLLDSFEVFATYRQAILEGVPCNWVKLDITREEAVLNAVNRVKPGVIVHCAALKDVDYCEEHQEEAWVNNVTGTENMVKAAEGVGAKIVYISTDFVFDGNKGSYKEEDGTNPINWYGKTKLEGERVTKRAGNYAIARVSVLYGVNALKKNNYVTWVLGKLEKKEPVRIVEDHYNSPTYAKNAALAIREIIVQDKRGIYHTAGSERISRYGFTLKIAETFGLDGSLVSPMKSSEFVQKAKRPRDSSLSVEKAEKELGLGLLNVDEGLLQMKNDLKSRDKRVA